MNFDMSEQDMAEKLNSLSALISHPGWRAFVARMEMDAANSFTHALHGASADEQAKHFNVHATLKTMLGWPEREMELLRVQLTAAKQE